MHFKQNSFKYSNTLCQSLLQDPTKIDDSETIENTRRITLIRSKIHKRQENVFTDSLLAAPTTWRGLQEKEEKGICIEDTGEGATNVNMEDRMKETRQDVLQAHFTQSSR